MPRVFIGVGSNQDDRLQHISEALHMLGRVHGVRVLQMAPVIETEPVGGPPQGLYLNTVIEIETILTPRELLEALKDIEYRQGRTRLSERAAPRPIDLDIVLYGDQIVSDPDLEIPHPRMHKRRFVLEPLAQLNSNVKHPVLAETVSSLLGRLRIGEVREYHSPSPETPGVSRGRKAKRVLRRGSTPRASNKSHGRKPVGLHP